MSIIESDTEFTLPTQAFLLKMNLKFDERALVDKVKENDVDELCIAALQIALHGWSGENFGTVVVKGVDKEVKDIFDENNVQYGNKGGDDIDSKMLTPKRVIRLFRFKIREYLAINKDQISFLSRKYCGKKGREYVFPGAEYLLTKDSEISDLLDAYVELDEKNGNSKFYDGAVKIFKARGIKIPDDE